VLDNSNGVTWDLAWLYRYTNGGLTLTPGIGVEWNSDNQNEYYYGVSRAESRRSGLNSYDPDNGWSPYLELTASYRLTTTGAFTAPGASPICLMKLKTVRWWINPGPDCYPQG
jgi:outer membrane protein